MNRLVIFRRVATLLFLMLTSVTLWGQAPTPTLSLLDPEAAYNATTNPYVVTSAEDWGKLASDVASGYSYDGEVIKLTANISVSTMVGAEGKPFSGTFNGSTGEGYGLYTLTFNYGTSGSHTNEEIVAPFRYTKGATITYLQVSGAIHTDAGKEAGLIGVNTRTDHNTTVEYVIVDLDLYCYESLWEEEGGGFAYDGRGVSFNACAYKGYISANNYQGGFCGNGDSNTTFENCLFNPETGGVYWAENFVYNEHEATIDYTSCYYTEGNNQEESEQGYLVYVGSVPTGSVGCYMTNLYGQNIYEPVAVVISGVSGTYIYNGSVISVTPEVTFDGVNAISNKYCTTSISPSPVQNVGTYTLSVTGKNAGEGHNYSGTVTKDFRVVEATDDWAKLQDTISNKKTTITLYKDYTAVSTDDALTFDRNVTINLNGHTIDRGFYNESTGTWDDPVENGQVIRINKNCTVVINGPGTITGGYNKAKNYNENSDNDGGGINNLGTLTLNNVTVTKNKCVKKGSGTSRTARGGGIYSGKGSRLTIVGGAVTYNESEGGGGGIYAHQATLFSIDKVDGSDDNTAIHGNKSLDKGGGIRVDAGATATIKNCDIYNNSVELHDPQSASNGGGIHLDAGTLDLTNCTVNNNSCSKFGGGIYLMGGTINADNCSINSNFSYDYVYMFEGCGGGVCILGGTFNMNGGTITDNTSSISYGGGIYVASGKTLRIKGSVNIYGNWTLDEGWNKHTTNVYLAGANDKITINASIVGARVGVSKNGGAGKFTNGLSGKGTTANFVSDNASYKILPDGNEAKLGVPAEMPSDVDDLHLPDGIEKVGDEYVIKVPFTIDQPVVIAKSVRFEEDGCIIITENGILRVPSITNDDPLKIIVEDGGQIIFTGTPGSVAARVKKDVKEFSNYSGYWYLISSPINNPLVSTATNIVVLDPDFSNGRPGYDLYRFNEAATATNDQGLLLQWENYRAADTVGEVITPVHPDFTTLANGRGYLYRSCQDYTVTIDGNLNVGTVDSYKLTNSGTNELKGFNIIGNPYPHNIKKGEGQAIPNTYLEDKYYVLNPEGCVWTLKTDATEIPPFTGILVQAKSEVAASGQTLTISDVTVSSSKGDSYEKASSGNIWFTVANNKYEDKACVEFRDGQGLNKIAHINEEAPMLYIHHNDEDFASVDMNPEVKAFNLNFVTKATSRYTLSYQINGDFSYLHLYDKLTGEDIDMLLEDEYTFVGSASDAVNRFVVRLSEVATNIDNNATFAYQSGDEIVVSGEGELQMFDVMGRLVMQKHVSGVQTIEKPSTTGVYIMRLNEMTQKIIMK